jgi:Formyl transferase
LKVLVLATDSSSTWMMVNALRLDYPDLKVVIEEPISKFLLLRRRMTRLGFFEVLGQILFMLCTPVLKRGTYKHIESLVSLAGLSTAQPVNVSIARFDSVNSYGCIEWLSIERPTVVVLNGTRIVSPALLSSCNAVFLNTHCGITPAYRGVHGGYWALACGDGGNFGVTVHLVDAGIDTGSIVYQDTIKLDKQDNFFTYPVKQYISAIPLMRQAISDAISNSLRPYRREDLPSAIWHHPTVWKYAWERFRHGVR